MLTAENLEPLAFGHTDIGRKRKTNQDKYALIGDLGLFMVADGMGGHAAGETASALAIKTVEYNLRQHRAELHDLKTATQTIGKLLIDSLRKASHHVYTVGMSTANLRGMGTTLTAIITQGGYAHMAHVGDSRLYHHRNGVLTQISEDHSLVQEQVKQGLITDEQAYHSRFKNVITRSIGFLDDVDVDYKRFTLHKNDKLLLCSDGLTNMLHNHTIEQFLGEFSPQDIPSRLIERANENGGDDNITAVVVAFKAL